MATRKGSGVPSATMRANIRRVARRATDTQWVEGALWYVEAGKEVSSMATDYGVSVECAAGVIAALSPQTFWSVNVRAARRILDTGEREPGTLTSNHKRAAGVMAGTIDPLTWQAKIGRFYRNILGDWEAVTVDAWASRIALGGDSADVARALARKGVYAEIERAYQVVAREFNIPPAVLQAVTWVAYRHDAYADLARARLHGRKEV